MKKRYLFRVKNWLRLVLSTAFAVFFSLQLQAQLAPIIQWDKTFGGLNQESITTLKQTTDGGYILGGWSDSDNLGINIDKTDASKGGKDYWIIKLDANGNKLWDKTIGANNLDELSSIQQTADGGYILGGTSESTSIHQDKSQFSKGKSDFWVVKLNSNGVKVWDKTFGGLENETLQSVIQTSDGGYLAGGHSRSGISGDKSQPNAGQVGFKSDCWIVKIDASGNKQWDKTFGAFGDDGLYQLQQTLDGGFVLGCTSTNGGKSISVYPSADYWVIKLDASGNLIWDNYIGGGWTDYFWTLQQTSDGGYILGGDSNSPISADKSDSCRGQGVTRITSDYWIVKLDASGNKMWDKTFGGNSSDYCKAIRQMPDGGYILGGSSSSASNGEKSEPNRGNSYSWDFWIVKLDANGNKRWDKTIGGNVDDEFNSLDITADGGLILGGYSNSGISGDKSESTKGGSDFWVIKLAPEVLGVKGSDISSSISIFPNPNQGKFTLHLTNLTSAKAEVTISDLLGRTILQQEFQTTNNQLSEEINLPNAKGIYLLQLKAGKQITSRKIVVE